MSPTCNQPFVKAESSATRLESFHRCSTARPVDASAEAKDAKSPSPGAAKERAASSHPKVSTLASTRWRQCLCTNMSLARNVLSPRAGTPHSRGSEPRAIARVDSRAKRIAAHTHAWHRAAWSRNRSPQSLEMLPAVGSARTTLLTTVEWGPPQVLSHTWQCGMASVNTPIVALCAASLQAISRPRTRRSLPKCQIVGNWPHLQH